MSIVTGQGAQGAADDQGEDNGDAAHEQGVADAPQHAHEDIAAVLILAEGVLQAGALEAFHQVLAGDIGVVEFLLGHHIDDHGGDGDQDQQTQENQAGHGRAVFAEASPGVLPQRALGVGFSLFHG